MKRVENKKGFTLIELLAVVVILGVIATIAVFAYSSYIGTARTKAYVIAETSMEEATEGMFARCYSNAASSEMCNLYGAPEDTERVLIYMKDLVDYGFIDAIKDPKNEAETCDMDKSYVFAYANPKVSGNFDIEYSACLKCSTYETPDCDFELDVEQDFGLVITGKLEDGSAYDGSWTNKNVILEFSAIDPYEFGIEGYKYSTTKNGGYKSILSGKMYSADMESTIWIKAYNKNKQYSAAVGHAVKIDKTKPTISSVTGNPTTWTKDDVTLTVNASDAGSGIRETNAYSFDGGTTWQTSNKKTFTENQTVKIVVRDALNHKSATKTVNITYIDKEIPVKPSIVSSSNGNWSTTDITLTLTSSAGSSGLYYQYSYDQSKWTTWSDSNSNVFTPAAFTAERNQNVYIRACSTAGICSEVASTPIKIDKTKPTISSVTGNPTDWHNGSVTLTVTASDNLSDINSYSFDNGSTWQTSNKKTFTTNQTVKILVKDNAGNRSALKTVTISKIDTSTPATPKITNPSGGNWTNANVTLTITSTRGTSGIYYQRSEDQSNWVTWENSDVENFTTTYSWNLNKTIYVRVCTNAGVCSATVSTTLKIDKDAPTISSVSGNPTSWQTTSATLTVTATDTGSSKIAGYSFDGGSSWQTSNSKVFSANETVKIYVKDNAGNISAVKEVTISKIDTSTPTKPTITNPSGGDWTNADVTLTIKSSKGVSGVYYQYSADQSTWTTWSSSNVTSFSPPAYTSNMNKTIYVRVCTNAGNCSSVSSTTLKIDKSAPTCGTVSGASTTWTSADRTISVACTDSTYGQCSSTTFSKTFNSGKTQSGTITISDKAGNKTNCSVNAYVDKTKYAITITNVTGGTFSASASSAMRGTTITVTATPSTNYALKTLKYNSTDITSTKKFTMPGQAVTITGTWEMTVITKYRYKTYTSKTCTQSKTCTKENCGYNCHKCCGSAVNWACSCCTGAASPNCGPSSASGSCCGDFHCCSTSSYDCSTTYDCSYWSDWSSWSTTKCTATSTKQCESKQCLASSSATGCTAAS